jgi:hypothetical protein
MAETWSRLFREKHAVLLLDLFSITPARAVRGTQDDPLPESFL